MAEGFQEIIPLFDHDAPRLNHRKRRKQQEFQDEKKTRQAIEALKEIIEGRRVQVALRLGRNSGILANTTAVFTTERSGSGRVRSAFLDGKRTKLYRIASISPEPVNH
jgi:hypothetical protein